MTAPQDYLFHAHAPVQGNATTFLELPNFATPQSQESHLPVTLTRCYTTINSKETRPDTKHTPDSKALRIYFQESR